MLARALRGDEEAGAEYCRVMEHDEDPQLRWAVTGAFGSISRPEDMPLLERIGTTDPDIFPRGRMLPARFSIGMGGRLRN